MFFDGKVRLVHPWAVTFNTIISVAGHATEKVRAPTTRYTAANASLETVCIRQQLPFFLDVLSFSAVCRFLDFDLVDMTPKTCWRAHTCSYANSCNHPGAGYLLRCREPGYPVRTSSSRWSLPTL